ncbi:hypothetical protein NLX67_04775 [Domibacillus sp. A3M-37]|uniref:hypothetical protein n=1 Tax=Domibacillus TaxID=1433999 RepID=UPI000617EF76|nr:MULTISPECIES: hypothetical protein [Domibacillus]MCP3761697.1 hypothetical protein [Domibacillus sp. A3M-37]
MSAFILNNLLAVLWIALFMKSKNEKQLQVAHFLFLAIAIGILIHSCLSAFAPHYSIGTQISEYDSS